jgi:hypothetical protein
VGLAVVLAVLAVAAFDHSRTEAKVPPLPTSNSGYVARYERIRQLDRDFDRRAWIYGGAAAVAMALAAAVALARAPTLAVERRVFGQAGVCGVVVGLAGVVLLSTVRGFIDPPRLAVFAPCLTLLGIAALGGTSTRLQRSPPEEPEERQPRLPLRRVAYAALGFTALTVLFALLYAAGQQGTCDTPVSDTGWSTAAAWAGVVSAIVAFVLGLTGLAARRWFVALVCVVVNPGALFYMVVSSGALCG